MIDRSPFLAAFAPLATAHHERLDGGGYHRGVNAAALPPTPRCTRAPAWPSALILLVLFPGRMVLAGRRLRIARDQ